MVGWLRCGLYPTVRQSVGSPPSAGPAREEGWEGRLCSQNITVPSLGQRRDFLQLIDELESVPIRKGTKASTWDACDPDFKGGSKLGHLPLTALLFFFFFGSGRPRGPKVIRKLGRKTGRQAGKQAKWAGRPVMHKPNSQDQGRQINEP